MAKSTIRERCHVNTNINEDTFVGIKCVNGDFSVNFPIGYDIEKDDRLLRKDILLLISVLSHNTDRKDSEINRTVSYNEVDFPLQAYLYVISDFYDRDYYKEREIAYGISKRGKINWRRTVKTRKPLIQSGDIYYLDFVTKKNAVNDNELITLIHKFCVYESFSKLGWLFSSFIPERPKIKFNKKFFISVVKTKLSTTFNDKNRELFANMLAILSSLGDDGPATDYRYGTTRFEYIWESMINKAYGINNKEDYFPKTTWILGEQERINSVLEPDTIMIWNTKIFILDAKYYKFGWTGKPEHLPETASINKQITYGEYVAEANKFVLKDGSHPVVYNAFLMPYNSFGKVFHTEKNIHYIGTAISDWKASDGTRPYEQVQGILLDVKTLMQNYSKDQNRIQKLAELIESHLITNGNIK